jgi:hypothetical protein
MDKQFTCTDLSGNEVTITYKAVLSAYDQEQINAVYASNMQYDAESRTVVPKEGVSFVTISILRQDAMVQTMVKSWTLDATVSPDAIKKALTAKTFARLMEELGAIVAEGEIDEAKKKSSPND